MFVIAQPKPAVRALATARAISITGGAASYLALNYYIFQLTHSAVWVSAALLLTFGTDGLLSPIAGAIGDRFDRQRVMIACDLAGAVLFGAMVFVHDPGTLLVVAFLTAVVEAPFWSASSAAIPALVAEKDISWANSMLQVGFNMGMTVGPAIGGLLVASIGASWVFGINAVSFAISACLVVCVRGNFREARRDDEDEYRGMGAGFVFAFRDRVLRTISIAWVAVVLGMGLALVADVPLSQYFGVGSFGYGLIITAWGGGSVVGSLAGRKLTPGTEGAAVIWGTFVLAIGMAATGLSPVFVPILIAVFLAGVADGVGMVGEQGILQRRTPDAVRSRVVAATHAAVHIAFGISFLFAGFVVEAIGPRASYLVAGVGSAIGFLILLRIRRDLRPRHAAE